MKLRIRFFSSLMSASVAFCMIFGVTSEQTFKGYKASASGYYGDANNDGIVDETDTRMLQEYLVGKTSDMPNLFLCDMDDDNIVNVFDLIYLKRFVTYGIYPGQSPSEVQTSATTTVTTVTTTTTVTTPSTEDITASYINEVFRLVNEERAAAGVSPLTLSEELSEATAIRAQELTEYYSHTRPNGEEWYFLLKNMNISYSYAGENIAVGSRTPERVMELWMNSEGHRENILNTDYTEIGIGFEYDPDSEWGYHWVQIFRQP